MRDKHNQRRIILEWQSLARVPLVAAETVGLIPTTTDVPDLEQGYEGNYPRVQARIVMPTDENGQIAPVSKVYDVHYHLLALASLTDYEETRIPFTAYGICRDLGWGHGGRQAKLVRRCVDHLYGATLELDGIAPDLIDGRPVEGSLRFRIIYSRWFPKEEVRTSGGRNTSWVSYNPDYLRGIAKNSGVRIDVEMMLQMKGGLAKAHYRYLSYLRSIGEDRMDLATAFEAAGANRSRWYPSDAKRVFGPCHEVMLRYRHITEPPRYERDKNGNYVMILSWGDPINLPSRADQLFNELVDIGVAARTAANMVAADQRKVGRLLRALRIGALPEPRENLPGLLVHLFRDPTWDIPIPDDLDSEQLQLLDELDGVGAGRRTSKRQIRLSVDDLIGAVRKETDQKRRAEYLRLLRTIHGVNPKTLGYKPDGSLLLN